MDANKGQKNSHQDGIIQLCCVTIRKISVVTVSLPLLALFICFVTAYIFRYDDVHETHCRVFNVIPSISAITGITPQTYLWRISIALHIGPRILIAHIYRKYFSHLSRTVLDAECWPKKLLVRSCYWLNIIELSSLCGVTYISNRENYPVHEKLFITFMVCSLTYMFMMTWSFKIVHPAMTDSQRVSHKLKKGLLILSIASTCTLIVFFLKHRLYCHDLAFTWFAFSEYVIASCNMGFHLTVALDFPRERLIVNSDVLPQLVKKPKIN